MSVTTAQYYYTYAGDDPINNIDPSGMCWTGLCWIKHGVRRFGHELEKPTYAVYIYSRWLNHKSRYTLTPLLVGPEALGLAGDMTGDALEGENPCDEGKPGHVPLINGKWFYGCHNGHIDIP
jgi:hypothetical protein